MKKQKYKNKKTEIDGIIFHSKKEADRYAQLKQLESCGAIENLELQPSFKIEHNGIKICAYKADFRYNHAGYVVVEDVKGFKTAVYKLKKKLIKAFFDLEILET